MYDQLFAETYQAALITLSQSHSGRDAKRLRSLIVQTKGALGILRRLPATPPLPSTRPRDPSNKKAEASPPTALSPCVSYVDETPNSHQGQLETLDFPSGLLLSPEDSSDHRTSDAIRSKSTVGISDLRESYNLRIRRGREDCQRRKSFSVGIAAHARDPPFFGNGDSECREDEIASSCPLDAFRERRHFSFNPSPSSSGSAIGLTSTGEQWPERICSYLTNGQRVSARLQMFRHFSYLLKIVQEQREETPLPPPKQNRLKLLSGAWTIAKPGKANGGEDAFFHARETFAGVADGVGEWGEYDCNPREFACELMTGSLGLAQTLPFHTSQFNAREADEKASLRALRVLRAGFEKAIKANNCFGSSTSLVVGLDVKGENLGVACLGDSTCIVLRRSQPLFRHMTIAKRTREQQHFFNCPYQLSKLPEKSDLPTLEQRGLHKLIRVLANLKPDMCSDSPEHADLTDLRIKEGDLIVLGTDGLFDNLFDQEIISLASLSLSPYESKLFLTEKALARPKRPASADSVNERRKSCARRLTEAWVTGELPHPLALEPPKCTSEFGIATPPMDVARGIAEAAFYRSIDGRARTPFAKAARAAGASAMGGKQDDITVVVCWVVGEDHTVPTAHESYMQQLSI